MEDLTGLVIKGYEIHEKVGVGGFGAVYRATQRSITREVAIKVILPELANDPNFIRSFDAEAQMVAKLEHPFIVPLFDYWREPDGAYLVMRYYAMGSLFQFLHKHHQQIDLRTIAYMVEELAGALTVAHQHQIVHRDIKPANILIDEQWNAYLTDFGIAKHMSAMRNPEDEGNAFTGSPAYVAPEILKSEPSSPLSDQYSFGIVIHEMIGGKYPYPNASLTDLLDIHLYKRLPLLATVSDEVNAVLQKATAKIPAARYANVLEMAKALRAAISGRLVLDLDDDLEQRTYVNPYKGLRPFEEADAIDFFGRETLVRQLLERIRQDNDGRFLAVVGPSGSGKSSVIHAGVLPALRQGKLPNSEQWYITSMLPGANPFESLSAALLSIASTALPSLEEQLRADVFGLTEVAASILPDDNDAPRLFLVIDQFEELFTLVESEADRLHFLNLIHKAVTIPDGRLYIVVTLRADYYDKPLLYEGFGALIQAHTQVVLPLTPEEIQSAIAGPAKRVGIQIDTELIAAIVADVREEPGTLPLLQYSLTEMYERRNGNRLSLTVYQTSGGVLGALARRAEEVYQNLDKPSQEVVKQIFLRLITLGEGTEGVRRRARRSELASVATDSTLLQKVLDAYGQYRLFTFDRERESREPTVEIAHEALIREWERLHNWLDESRNDLRLQRMLAVALGEWVNTERKPDYLLYGSRLTQFEEWRDSTALALNQDELDYIAASLKERQRLAELEIYRRAREDTLEHQAKNRLRSLVIVFFVATILSIALSIFALTQQQSAQQERDNALIARQTSDANSIFAQEQAKQAKISARNAQSAALAASAQNAISNNNPDLALALALQANSIESPPIQAQRILYDLAFQPATIACLKGHSAPVYTVLYLPDGKQILSSSGDMILALWDVNQHELIRRFEGHTDAVWAVALLDDGQRALSGSDDMRLILWDLNTGTILREFEGHQDAVRALAVRDTLAVSGSMDGVLIAWDLNTGEIIRQFETFADSINSVAISPDGQFALVGLRDGNLIHLDLNTGEEINRLIAHNDAVRSVAISPDGLSALSGGADNQVIYWNIDLAAPIHRFEGHTDRVLSVAYSADGRYIISGSSDATIMIWDLTNYSLVERYVRQQGSIASVNFNPQGQTFVSGSLDALTCLWDIANQSIRQQFIRHTGTVNTVTYAPNGLSVASGSSDTQVRLWDSTTGQLIHTFAGHLNVVTSVIFSPDGQALLSGSFDRTVHVWEIASGNSKLRFEGHNDWVTAIAVSPDSLLVLSGDDSGVLILWDMATGKEIRRFEGHTTSIANIGFSRDGQLAFSSSIDNQLMVWDIATGEAQWELNGTTFAYLPEQNALLAGQGDNSLTLWDITTGKPKHQFGRQNELVRSIAVTPDETTAILAIEQSVVLFDLNSGQAIHTFTEHTDQVFSVVVSPDGTHMLSGGDTRMIEWRAPSIATLLEWTRAHRYIRDLSCEERILYNVELCEAE